MKRIVPDLLLSTFSLFNAGASGQGASVPVSTLVGLVIAALTLQQLRLLAADLRAGQPGEAGRRVLFFALAAFLIVLAVFRIHYPASWLASLQPLVPPLAAIFLAFLTGEVLFSLFCGIWLGAIFIQDLASLRQIPEAAVTGFARTVDHYFIQSLMDKDKLSIVLFTIAIGGLVGVVARSGGTRGVVDRVLEIVRGPRTGQAATVTMGLSVFFDDYASCLIVGNTARPMTDRLRISREKIAYLIDSTAAPIACIAFISTWIGFQLGLLQDAFIQQKIALDPYYVFLQSIPYSFYSIFTIFFVFLVAVSGRDFGPMFHAESRARSEGKLVCDSATPISSPELDKLEPPVGVKPRARNAVLPVLVLLGGILAGLFFTGRHNLLQRPPDELFAENLFRETRIVNHELFVDTVQRANLPLVPWEKSVLAEEIHRTAGAEGINPQILLTAFLCSRPNGALIRPLTRETLRSEIEAFASALNSERDARSAARDEHPANAAVLARIGGYEAGSRYHQVFYEVFLGLRDILGASSSLDVLLWVSFGAGAFAMLLALLQGILNIEQCFSAWFEGAKAMAMAVMVLTLAWSLGRVCDEMHTADYVAGMLGGVLAPALLPVFTFMTAAAIAFATGTSWATMTILIPIIVKLSAALSTADDFERLLIMSIAAVLSGAVFGDHCSPISDTTIMSSLSAGCDHIHHVRTQMPYAFLTGTIAALCGYLPAGCGVPWYLSWPLALVVMIVVYYSLSRALPELDEAKLRKGRHRWIPSD